MSNACPRCGGPMAEKFDASLTCFDACVICGWEDYGTPDPTLPNHERYSKAARGVWAKRKRGHFGERLPVAGQKQSVNRSVP